MELQNMVVELFDGPRFRAYENAQRITVLDKKCQSSRTEFIGSHSFEQAKKRARSIAKSMAKRSQKYGCGN